MVRIRTMPLKPSRKLEVFFMFVILTKEESKKFGKDISSNPDDASRRDTEMCLFFLCLGLLIKNLQILVYALLFFNNKYFLSF